MARPIHGMHRSPTPTSRSARRTATCTMTSTSCQPSFSSLVPTAAVPTVSHRVNYTSNCSMFRADWHTFGFVVSKSGASGSRSSKPCAQSTARLRSSPATPRYRCAERGDRESEREGSERARVRERARARERESEGGSRIFDWRPLHRWWCGEKVFNFGFLGKGWIHPGIRRSQLRQS